MERFAAIDVGTNTVLLLAVAIADGRFRVLADRAEIARLGEGVDREGRLSEAAQRRVLETLRRYRDCCRELGVGEIAAVGTSALRDAANRAEFQRSVREELGIKLRVLSEGEEAFYSFLAVDRGLRLPRPETVVVDVGGGSVELVWGRPGEMCRWTSVRLGSVRLTERYLRSDPVRDEEYEGLCREIDCALAREIGDPEAPFRPRAMVGLAGTFTTLVAVERGLKEYSHSEVHGAVLRRSRLRAEIALFRRRTIAERKEIAGLEPGRADVILAGAALVDRIMEFFSLEQAWVSDQGIRYGLVHERIGVTYG